MLKLPGQRQDLLQKVPTTHVDEMYSVSLPPRLETPSRLVSFVISALRLCGTTFRAVIMWTGNWALAA